MKKLFISGIIIAMVLCFSIQAHADPNLIGQGTSTHGTYNLIYDTDLDITWYDYTNATIPWKYNPWQMQVDWADALSVTFGSNTYTDWRLPTTVDGPYVVGYDGTTTAGYNITTSEMGSLFYTGLGNAGRYDTTGNPTGCGGVNQPSCLTITGDFQNLKTNYGYWTGTEVSANTGSAWAFFLNSGLQNNGNKLTQHVPTYALAVRPGLAVVPEPGTFLLLGSGLVGMAFFREKTRRHKKG